MKYSIKKLFKKPRSTTPIVYNHWRMPTTALEVVSKAELDEMQQETIEDLQKEGVLNPKALFYLYKYIDAKFNKKDFNVEDRFIAKANMLDQFYSEGMAEVYADFTDYEELVKRTIEANLCLRRAIVALDPEADVDTAQSNIKNDAKELEASYNQLSKQLNWKEQ